MLKSLLATLFPLAALAADANMFRGGAAHSGVYEGTAAPQLAGVKWKFKTNGKVISSPAIAGGVVYVGSTDGRVYAVDAASGMRRWAFPTKGPVNSSPAVFSDTVYFGSVDGNFYAVNPATGKEI